MFGFYMKSRREEESILVVLQQEFNSLIFQRYNQSIPAFFGPYLVVSVERQLSFGVDITHIHYTLRVWHFRVHQTTRYTQ